MMVSDEGISKETAETAKATLKSLLMASDVTGDENQVLSHMDVLTILSNTLIGSMATDTATESSFDAEKQEKEDSGGKDEKEIEKDADTMSKNLKESINIVIKRLGEMGRTVGGKLVCQYAFTQNDIVWICKTCQVDETCVLCNSCFMGSNHSGHEVFFYHTLNGGCCDCGDPEAWDKNGFCKDHGIDGIDPLASLSARFVSSGQLMVSTIVLTLKELASEMRSSFTIDALGDGCGGEYSNMLQQHDNKDPPALVFYNNEMLTAEEFQRSLFLAVHNIKDDPEIRSNVLNQMVVSRLLSSFSRGHEETEISLPHSVSYSDVIRVVKRLTSKPYCFLISIRTPSMIVRCRRASSVIYWMLALSRTSSALCRLVAGQFDESSLELLMLCDAYLPHTLRHSLHDLYLELMADQPFKQCIAAAYTRTLLPVSRDFTKGIGRAGSCLNCLSVQFLNRKVFVNSLIEKNGGNFRLLEDLCRSILITLEPAMKGRLNIKDGNFLSGLLDSPWGGSELDPCHPVLRSRRYHPATIDLKCLLNVDGVPRRFITKCLSLWLLILRFLNNVGGQRRVPRAHGHVAFMSRDWVYAWNACTSTCMQFEQALSWMHDESAAYSVNDLESSTYLFSTVINVFEEMRSHQEEILQRRARTSSGPGYVLLSQLPCNRQSKCTNNERLLLRPPPAQRSFHPIIHRFFAAAVREACRSPNSMPLEYLKQEICGKGIEFITWFLDAPLLTLELSSEVVAGIWRRNGFVLKEQVMNYQELPFCRVFRDLDVLAVQVAGVICSARLLVNHILHRYRCWHFFYSGELDRGMTWNRSPDIVGAALDVDPNSQSDVRHRADDVRNDESQSMPRIRRLDIFAEPSQHEDEDIEENEEGNDEYIVVFDVVNGEVGLTEGSGDENDTPDSEMEYNNNGEMEIDQDQEHTVTIDSELIIDAVEESLEEYKENLNVTSANDNGPTQQQRLRNRRGSDDISPGRLDADQQQDLGVECLILFIRLITEIPSPPDTIDSSTNGNHGGGDRGVNNNSSSILNQLRREVLHLLACGPATHSELEEVSSLLGQKNAISEGKLDEILDAVAVKLEENSLLEPGKYTLKTDLYEEYDQGFWHVPLLGHQKALERREESRKVMESSLLSNTEKDKSKSRRRPRPAPMCPPPQPAHPFFESFRIGLATEEALLLAIERLLREVETTGPSAILSCALHLLTLAVHIVIQETDSRNRNIVTTTDPEEDSCSGTDLKNMSCNSAITLAPCTNVTGRRRLQQPFRFSLHHFCNTLLSTGIVTSLVSLSTKGLLDCDFTTLAGVNWLLQQLYRMHDGCRRVIPASCSGVKEKAVDVEVMTTNLSANCKQSESARARALAAVHEQAALFETAMREQAAPFEAGNREGGLDEEVTCETTQNNTTAGDTVSSVLDANAVQCIVCHEVVTRAACVKGADDQSSGFGAALIGRIAFIQRSTVLCGPERPGLHVQSCGHALHQECFHQYFVTVAEQQEAGRMEDPEMGMALNLTKGEFKCPMCKTVANSFVPWAPSLHSDQPPHNQTSCMETQCVPVEVVLACIKFRLQQPELSTKIAANGIKLSSAGDNLTGRSDTNSAMIDEKQVQQQLPISAITADDRKLAAAPSSGTCLFQETAQNFLQNLGEVEGSSSMSYAVELQDVNRAASAAAYTASSLLAELKASLPGGGDETKRAMGITLLFECLRVAVQQPLMSKKLYSTLLLILEEGQEDTGGLSEPCMSEKLLPTSYFPLLERNLLEILVLLFCVLPENEWRFASTTLCVARGVQVCLAVMLQQQKGMASATTWLPWETLKDCMLGKSRGDTCNGDDIKHVKMLDKCLRDSLNPFAQAAHLIMKLLSCKDVSELPSIVNKFGEGLLQNAPAGGDTGEGVSHASFWSPSSLAEMRMVFEGHFNWDSTIRSWVYAALKHYSGQTPTAFSIFFHLLMNRQGDWPSAAAPKLHNLPRSYTELHSRLNVAGTGIGTGTASEERIINSAICLSCGSVGPARSMFYIAHAKKCGLGYGIFFLQKECASLLVNGKHVMLYASPYTDTHGENLTYKGKPLFLDERRLGLLHGLLLRHVIPQTIIQS